MYKHIYNQFKHWYPGGTIWFYSDPHFSDVNEIDDIHRATIDRATENKRYKNI